MDNQSATPPIAPEVVQPPVVPVSPQSIQSSTNSQNPQDLSPYDALDPIHQYVCEMRFRWLPYSMIADSLKTDYGVSFQEQTLRSWCAIGGECHEALAYLKVQRSKEIIENLAEANAKLKETALDAIGVLKIGMTKKITAEQRAIAQDILDRSGFPKTSKIEGKQDISVQASQEFTDAIVSIANSIKK